MGNWAEGFVHTLVSAGLVGLFPQAHALAQRAVEWFDRSLQRNEDFGGETETYHQRLVQGKALALWLRDGSAATEVWAEAFRRQLSIMERLRADLRGNGLSALLDELMACAVQGGCNEAGVAAYQSFLGERAAKLTPRTVRKPHQLAYLLCAEALAPAHGAEALHAAGRQVLQAHLAERWLHLGQIARSGMWLKIVHGIVSKDLNPSAVLLRAYEDMPTIPRPSFLVSAGSI
ncbi:hypothetical protein [Inhella inkyongensis]|uniref:hypothetical protein n=1 Tax=Inhella inkyongensis TaxID=392593 RepID=UPI0015860586|nr:hypothetical protein [Inhella inkyongensis]